MSFNTIFGSLFDGYIPSILLATAAVLLICWQQLAVKLDPREPPILKPTIPFIGHIIGILRHQSSYFDILSAKSPIRIRTLPMMNSKLYVITEPLLVQSAFRSKNLSFEPFMVEFAQRMLGVSDETMGPIKNIPKDEKETSFLRDFVKEIHTAMMGQSLYRMNAETLNQVADTVNGIGDVVELGSLYLWLRTMLTIATCNALLGSYSPLKDDPSLVDSLWDFDAGLIPLLLNLFPSVIAPKAYKGRATVQAALAKYYTAKHDLEADVSQMVKGRAATFRKYGIPDSDIGKFELALLNVSTANAIPTLFWLICHICSDPSLTASIREELSNMVVETNSTKHEGGKREVIVDVTKFDTAAPLLVSAYRETIRITSAQLGTRRVMNNTMISDGKTSYLLIAGCDVQLPAGIPHLSPDYWGPTATAFDARRFLKPEDRGAMTGLEKEEDKVQKRAYFPFGGGKHLCPGRNFAFAEILGTAAILILGFEVAGEGGGALIVPEVTRSNFGEGIAKPRSEGAKMGARVERRKGWENVVWKFVC